MRAILLSLIFFLPVTFADDPDTVKCVHRCEQRFFNGRCVRYGNDYCAPGSKVACIPHCRQRSNGGKCLDYMQDFCGDNPGCDAYCEYASSSGTCLRYGVDQCYSDYEE